MSLLDFLLNLAGLILWGIWRSRRFVPAGPAPTPASLAATLHPTSTPKSRWTYLAMLLLILGLRPFFYWQVGSELGWNPSISLEVINLTFRSNLAGRIFLFSFLTFVITLGLFYSFLILLSLLDYRLSPTDPYHRLVRCHLGAVSRLPWILRLLLPWAGAALAWIGLVPILVKLGMVPPFPSFSALVKQGAIIGLEIYFPWQHLLFLILVGYQVLTFVSLGSSPFWSYLQELARPLLAPLRPLPLRLARFDLRVMVLLLFLIGLSLGASRVMAWLSRTSNV